MLFSLRFLSLLKEMYDANMIEPNGKTSLTSRNKRSRQWVLCKNNIDTSDNKSQNIISDLFKALGNYFNPKT